MKKISNPTRRQSAPQPSRQSSRQSLGQSSGKPTIQSCRTSRQSLNKSTVQPRQSLPKLTKKPVKKTALASSFYLKVVAAIVMVFLLGQFGWQIWKNRAVLGLSTYYDLAKVVNLINEERYKYGLAPLKTNAKLETAAYDKGENMLAEGYWAHNSTSGKQPWDFIAAANYEYLTAGENLARDFASEEEMVAAWMASPTHRANILNPRYKELGLATVEGLLQGESVVMVVNMFGNPNNTEAAPAPTASNQDLPTSRGAATPIPETTIEMAVVVATDPAVLFTSGAVLGSDKKQLLTTPQVLQILFGVAAIATLGFLSYKIFFPRRKILKK